MCYCLGRDSSISLCVAIDVKSLYSLLALILSVPSWAQTTCYTDPHGTTLCSTPEGVIRGTTSSTGQSVYRDERGNRLDYEVSPFGDASIERPSGETIEWLQSAPADADRAGDDTVPGAGQSRPQPDAQNNSGMPREIQPH